MTERFTTSCFSRIYLVFHAIINSAVLSSFYLCIIYQRVISSNQFYYGKQSADRVALTRPLAQQHERCDNTEPSTLAKRRE